MDLLSKTGSLGAYPANTPVDSTVKLDAKTDEVFDDVGHNQRLVGKMIYVTFARPDTTYVVGVFSQFMHAPHKPH